MTFGRLHLSTVAGINHKDNKEHVGGWEKRCGKKEEKRKTRGRGSYMRRAEPAREFLTNHSSKCSWLDFTVSRRQGNDLQVDLRREIRSSKIVGLSYTISLNFFIIMKILAL